MGNMLVVLNTKIFKPVGCQIVCLRPIYFKLIPAFYETIEFPFAVNDTGFNDGSKQLPAFTIQP
jgi:hypothetical protein